MADLPERFISIDNGKEDYNWLPNTFKGLCSYLL